ncbi:MAG: sulfotransferase [Parvularculaceae bacterium]|nr:sulfotransferase [Parvularculaceae bacterium]
MPQPPNLFLEGLQAAENRDFARADAIAYAMLARDPNDVSGLQIKGFSCFRRGRNSEALAAFERANQIAPGQPALLYWIGVLYKERGMLAQAERAFADAVRRKPQYGEALCHLGETQYYLDRKDEATASFERAIAAEPQSPVVLSKAARHFERVHDLARARALAGQALEIAPDYEIALIARSEIDLREKRHDEIIAALAPILSPDAGNERNASRLYYILASAYDKTGAYQSAYDAYCASHALTARIHGARIAEEQSPLTIDSIKRSNEFFAGEDVSAWPPAEKLEGDAPVFLLGFVRSGTTWLDQILASHPDIMVMEEEDNFVDAWRAFAQSDDRLQHLKTASTETINEMRAAYWKRARAILREAPNGRLVVDKVPLNTVQLGLIHRLFPDAKIIFATRDPRDVILSAFQQHFEQNYAMFQFLNFDSAAAYYDLIMSFGMMMREKSVNTFHDVRYEDVVADLEGEARRLTAFLDVPWHEAMLAYDETARKRAVRTASATQVIQRPYSTSIGKWKYYRDEMASVMPVLAPWVERFGYDND